MNSIQFGAVHGPYPGFLTQETQAKADLLRNRGLEVKTIDVSIPKEKGDLSQFDQKRVDLVLSGLDTKAGTQLIETRKLKWEVLSRAGGAYSKYKVPQQLLNSLRELVETSIQQQEAALLKKAKK